MTVPVFVEFRFHGSMGRNNTFVIDVQSIVRVDDADWGRALIYYTVGNEARLVEVDEQYNSVMKRIDAALADTKEG